MWKSEFEAAARQLGVTLVSVGVQSPSDIERVFPTFKERGVEAIVVMPDGLLYTQQALIVTLSTQQRLPAVHTFRQEAEAGALMAYGANVVELSRQAAVYVGKILKRGQASRCAR